MNEELKKEIQQMIDDNNSVNQFAVAQTPFHTHNNSDSPRIPFENLSGKQQTLSFTLFGTQASTAGNYSVFFTAPFAFTINTITEVHTVLGTDGGAVTLNVEKLIGTTAPASGIELLTSDFDLKGTINTVLDGSLTESIGDTRLEAGDRLALKLTGTPTSVENVTITITIKY